MPATVPWGPWLQLPLLGDSTMSPGTEPHLRCIPRGLRNGNAGCLTTTTGTGSSRASDAFCAAVLWTPPRGSPTGVLLPGYRGSASGPVSVLPGWEAFAVPSLAAMTPWGPRSDRLTTPEDGVPEPRGSLMSPMDPWPRIHSFLGGSWVLIPGPPHSAGRLPRAPQGSLMSPGPPRTTVVQLIHVMGNQASAGPLLGLRCPDRGGVHEAPYVWLNWAHQGSLLGSCLRWTTVVHHIVGGDPGAPRSSLLG